MNGRMEFPHPIPLPLFGGEGRVRGVFWGVYVGQKREDHRRRRGPL
jgi:hypothetical protein